MFLAIFWSFKMIRYDFLAFEQDVYARISGLDRSTINCRFFVFSINVLEEHFYYAFESLI